MPFKKTFTEDLEYLHDLLKSKIPYAITRFAREHHAPLNTIEAGWKTNLEVRPEKDWEQKIGRAVSDDNK